MNNQLLGKFNSVDDLVKAYLSLQAEFTKKCQQLAVLKAAAKSIGNEQLQPSQTAELKQTELLQAELPQQTEEMTQAQQTELDAVQQQTQSAELQQAETQQSVSQANTEQCMCSLENGQSTDDFEVLIAECEDAASFFAEHKQQVESLADVLQKFRSPKLTAMVCVLSQNYKVSLDSVLNDDSFVERILSDRGIKQRILATMIAESKGLPKTITGNAVYIATTPVQKPKTLSEAAEMAKNYFN